MSDKFELISFGEATFDVFIKPEESDVFCQIDTEKSFVAFSYADKIPVTEFATSLGGNAANNAVGSSRLGLATAVVLTLGDDEIGERIFKKLADESVETSFVSVSPNTPSSYSTIVRYSGERTIFVYHPKREYQFPKDLPSSSWAYLTSMGENFAPFYEKVAEWVAANNIKLAFNPGGRQIKAGAGALARILTLCEIIFVNREEAGELTGIPPKDKPGTEDDRQLLRGLLTLGPKKAVITDGPNGSFATDGGKFWRCGIIPEKVVERTGVGDAFGTGVLAALILGKSLAEAILWGTANSTSVIGSVGAQNGLLKKEELSAWLGKARSAGVEAREF